MRGTVIEKQPQRLVVDVNGVGYEVLVPVSTYFDAAEPGSQTPITLHVHTHVREDALQLFGFASRFELDIFTRLIGISGIGPKLALAVLSGIEPAELVRAVRAQNIARLTSIPGVGKKTAERIGLELRDRLPEAFGAADPAPLSPNEQVRADLMSALANLGYPRPAAEKAADAVLRDASTAHTLETALRAALRELTRQ
ncbi:MAG TPA: Holliday junction branch migration protein RuvA [Vicinamibacterales bacterium]|nr:Holliday junction branch migration protein RuvA [Vicinamibacterales bacterium]